MQQEENNETDVLTGIALTTVAPVYALLHDNEEKKNFLADAFFAAHCPENVASSPETLLRNPDALKKSGLLDGPSGKAMSPDTAAIVKAYVDQDGNGGMFIRPIAEPYYTP
ncbi:MAG: hypothetical protein H6862_05045 [Rhodospirillales bacterium]|nr:hypothetical protein [Rhodospirillales bacterium]